MLTAASMPVCQEAIARHFVFGVVTCRSGVERLDRGLQFVEILNNTHERWHMQAQCSECMQTKYWI